MLILIILFTKTRGDTNNSNHVTETKKDRAIDKTRCTPVKMVITVEFTEQALTETYRHVKTVLLTEKFRKTIKENKDKWNIDLSAHAHASVAGIKAGGGFRAAGGRAWEELMTSVTNDRRNEQKETSDLKKFNKRFTQIYRTTTVQVTVNGAVATSKSEDWIDSAPISESPDYEELRAMAEKHVYDNYGNIFGGRVEGNQYTATTCVAEGGFIPCHYREKETEGTCSWFSCSGWRGETECVNSYCDCALNHFTPDGEICHPCEEEKFYYLGSGACRPNGCDIKEKDCRVKGYFANGMDEIECHDVCYNERSCTGYEIMYKSPHQCKIYGKIKSSAVPGWTKISNANRFVPGKTSGSGDADWACFKRKGYQCSKFRAIKSSKCPKDLDLPECTVDMIYGELCEADKTLPDGNDNFNIDNCGDFDIFECSGY